MVLRMRLFAELNEHWRSACWMLSSASMVQRSHVGEDMSGMLSLKSLSLVGRMSWSICQRKVVWSEGRPGVTAGVQACSQSRRGYLDSILQVLGTCTPLSLTVCVTLISKSALYHLAVSRVLMLSSPSSLTSLILAKKLSG